ncbi:MAG: DNRLRE domain-containing protein [Chloroflexota bacterium]
MGGNPDFLDSKFWHSFLRFDLSAIPAGAEVTGATLELVCAYTLGSDPYATLNLYPANASWAESSVTWSNQPGRNATPVANDRIDNASYLTYEFTVTEFVQDWLAGTTANNGFRLEVVQTAAASGKVDCRSSDYATASLRPKLTVSWYPQEGPFVRSYYSLGGQTIALRKVGGDSPGLYYVYTDHLGSTSRLSDNSGSPVLGSDARFLPFGKYRTTPTAALTDRGFTGHLHNDPVGLVYMNARYYVPYINRFLAADTILTTAYPAKNAPAANLVHSKAGPATTPR